MRGSANESLHRSTQGSMTATGPSWMEMSHEVRAQKAKEVLLQVNPYISRCFRQSTCFVSSSGQLSAPRHQQQHHMPSTQ